MDILSCPQEEHIQLAITAICDSEVKPDSTPNYSIQQAGEHYGIPWSTLGRCLKGGQGCWEAHAEQQLLTDAQEGILANWVKVQGHHGILMTYTSIAQAAAEISGKEALNPSAVNEFYDMLTNVINKYDIRPENTYNMDEKGIQLGIGAKVTVMVDKDQKTAYSVEDGNPICANGSIFHPSVIFQAHISISPNGWTDQELGLEWLQCDFDPATQDKGAGQYCLLILDGHNSHCTFKFCQYALNQKIIIICLPSHTTHALQPCDVGAFGPLAQCWKRVVTMASQSVIAITKDNLLSYYHKA
ncbi:DDE superfamily endonuclease-domain-containing protein [Armillaria luteobubalina]|uniref:DDE superfamily endonuclease-domain-containing protein n=1 Tax=Armillaria luteobubalina TaxID=153913 RepID=A0AA39QM71_9AGAR|nr:DDE superfamily endonuclease-domain-containing protein [Armillaria luteobubalina]